MFRVFEVYYKHGESSMFTFNTFDGVKEHLIDHIIHMIKIYKDDFDTFDYDEYIKNIIDNPSIYENDINDVKMLNKMIMTLKSCDETYFINSFNIKDLYKLSYRNFTSKQAGYRIDQIIYGGIAF
jgi:hypothetical protein